MSASLQCLDVARAGLEEPLRQTGQESFYHCPNPKHIDRHPSLQINHEKNVWMCGPCGASGNAWQLAAFIGGLDPNDKAIVGSWLRRHGLLNGQSGSGPAITVDDLARDKRLPADFLRNLGLKNVAEGVLIPYRLMDGSPAPRHRARTALVAKEGSRWDTREGPIIPYGRWRLREARAAGLLVVVEGESDCWTLWHHGFPALGIPGASMVGCIQAEDVENISKLFLVREPDAGGSAFVSGIAKRLGEIVWRGQAFVVSLSRTKDPNQLHKANEEKFKERFQAALDTAELLKTQTVAGFILTRLEDLLNELEETTAYLVDGILPSGGLSALVSKPKVGKSTLARELTLRVAQGEPFLGRKTVKGPAIYLALEEKRSEVRKHFQAMGATGAEEIYIHTAHAPADALRALEEAVRQKRPALIIIDPLQKLMRVKDGNDYAQVTLALEPYLVFARESNAHLVVVHHLGKNERSDPTDGILGSTAIFAGVDTAIILKKTAHYRTIQTSQRYGENLPEVVLEFDSETKTVSLGERKERAEEKRAAELILEFLGGSDGPQPEALIIQEVEGRTKFKKAALRTLVTGGKVGRRGAGKKGDPFLYSKIENASSQHTGGTREPESQKVDKSPLNNDEMLVPGISSDSQSDPETREPEFNVEF